MLYRLSGLDLRKIGLTHFLLIMLLQPSQKSGYGMGYHSEVPVSVQKVLYPTVLFTTKVIR